MVEAIKDEFFGKGNIAYRYQMRRRKKGLCARHGMPFEGINKQGKPFKSCNQCRQPKVKNE